jgi:hypothetical protein
MSTYQRAGGAGQQGVRGAVSFDEIFDHDRRCPLMNTCVRQNGPDGIDGSGPSCLARLAAIARFGRRCHAVAAGTTDLAQRIRRGHGASAVSWTSS